MASEVVIPTLDEIKAKLKQESADRATAVQAVMGLVQFLPEILATVDASKKRERFDLSVPYRGRSYQVTISVSKDMSRLYYNVQLPGVTLFYKPEWRPAPQCNQQYDCVRRLEVLSKEQLALAFATLSLSLFKLAETIKGKEAITELVATEAEVRRYLRGFYASQS